MEYAIGFTLFAIAIAIYGYTVTRKNKKAQIAEDLEKNTFQLSGSTLYMKKSNKHLRPLLAVKKHEVSSYHYNEEKLHVGAVTVGGVTTGGVYKTGGDYSVGKYDSDKYELIFQRSVSTNLDFEKTKIEKIVLSDELMQKAKGQPIEQYLEKNTITVIKEVPASQTYVTLMQMGKTDAALSLLESEQAQGYPSKEMCDTIIAFLCAE